MDFEEGYMQSMLQIERLEAQTADMASTIRELRSQVKEIVVVEDEKSSIDHIEWLKEYVHNHDESMKFMANLSKNKDSKMSENEVPYGEHWKNMLLPSTNEQLIELIRQACLRRDELQIENDKINLKYNELIEDIK